MPIALLLLALTSCAFRPARAVPDIPPGKWHATLGGPARAAFLDETVPAEPREAWRERYEGGISAAPLVQGGLLIVANARGVTVASALDGSRYWSSRFDGPVIGAPLRHDTMLFVATASRRGRVHALSIGRGRTRWRTRLSGPVTSDPVLFENTLFTATVRRELYALESATGAIRWRIRLPGQSVTAPLVHERSLLLATQRDTLVRLSTLDGSMEAVTALPGSPSAPLALSDSTLIVALHPDRIAGFHARTLAPRWTVRVEAPVLAAPVVDADGTVYVLSRAGDVWRITGGGAATRLVRVGGTARESLTLTKDALLVGRLDGTLFGLARDGSERWQERFRSSVRSPVAVRDGELFVALLDGTVVNLR